MPTDDVLAAFAQRLREAERTRTPVAPFAHELVGHELVGHELGEDDIAAGYAVQDINVRHWTQDGRRVVGRKIGLTNAAVQRQLGVDQPDYGTLFADMQVADGGGIARARLIAPRIEAEVAVIMAKDVAEPKPSMVDLIGAIAVAVPALEVVDSRIADWRIGIVDTIADNGASAGFVLGPDSKPPAGVDLTACGMTLFRNGEVASRGAGRDCLGHPLHAALWLARRLAAAGAPLRARDVVLTGALGPMVEAHAGDRFEAHIDGFAPVRLRMD